MSEIPFTVSINSGSPAYEQVIEAVHRALTSGVMKAGDPFPSVRKLSKAVRINPNTAHKVVHYLVAEGTLEVLPGLGTRITEQSTLPLKTRTLQIQKEIEALCIHASRLGFSEEELRAAVTNVWKKIHQ